MSELALAANQFEALPQAEDYFRLAAMLALKFTRHSSEDVKDSEEYGDALLGLAKALNGYDPSIGKFSTLAYKSMMNAIINGRKLRKRQYRVPTCYLEDLELDFPDKAGHKIPLELTHKFFDDDPSYSDADRRNLKALKDYFFENKTWKEIGEEMGVTGCRAMQCGQLAIKLIGRKFESELE